MVAYRFLWRAKADNITLYSYWHYFLLNNVCYVFIILIFFDIKYFYEIYTTCHEIYTTCREIIQLVVKYTTCFEIYNLLRDI